MERDQLQPSFVLNGVRIQHVYHAFNFLNRCEKNQNMPRSFFPIYIYDGLEYLKEVVTSGLLEVVNENLMQTSCNVHCFYC